MPGRDPNAVAFGRAGPQSLSDESSGASHRTSSRWSFSRPERTTSSLRLGMGSVPRDESRYPRTLEDSEQEDDSSEIPFALGPPHMSDHRRPSQGEISFTPFYPSSYSETQGSIRDDTALLSDMLLSPAAPPPMHQVHGGSPHSQASFSPLTRGRAPTRPQLQAQQTIGPSWASPLLHAQSHLSTVSPPSESRVDPPTRPKPSISTVSELNPPTASSSGGASPTSALSGGRSILTMLLERERNDSSASDTTIIARDATASAASMPIAQATPAIKLSAGSDSSGSSQDGATTPRAPITSSIPRQLAFPSSSPPSDDLQTQQHRIRDEEEAVHASTPLLAKDKQRYDTFVSPSLDSAFDSPSTPPQHFYTSPHPGIPPSTKDHVIQLLVTTRQYITPKAFATGVGTTIEAFPAILLGLLLNVLDGVSYGFIMFPAGPVFAGFGPMGVSMFFLTTLISQLVYSFGGSSFPGASASMIIEVIPFFHILANEIVGMLGEENAHAIVATTMVAFALSSIITGLTFLLLGVLKLGSIIGFFPRHILVGCIGGVGVFLIQTGLSVCAGLGEEDSDFTWSLLKIYFTDTRILTLWVPAFTLAALLRVITHRYHHQLIFPLYFVALPIIFYLVVLAGGFDVSELREAGWVFNVGEAREPWYQFYTLFDFRAVSWRAIWATMPTQLALLFFNILHPPLNVPALGVSLGKDDVDLNRELVGHGVSNLIAGAFGTPSNYLAYVNTLLFYRVGGTTRYAGFLLALATFGLLLIGTGPIAYIPVLEVGALIFVLGIDLVKEAVWDPWPRTSRSEYITIIGIMACMTVYDFVSGVLFGIILACVFFVIQNSQRHSIRNIYSGATALSPVRRPSAHRKYLQEVGTQTSIMRLQGHLFFGTISKVEETCRAILEQHAWERNPIRFLVIDLALVGGLDLSAAEAFVRVQRLLVAKQVILVFCGQPPDSDVATALQAVGLWSGSAQTFASLNEALEWTENAYLRAWYASPGVKNESPPRAEHQPIESRQNADHLFIEGSFVNSPRRNHVVTVGTRIMDAAAGWQNSTLLKEQPFNTIVKTFSAHLGLNDQFVARIVPYFKAQALAEGEVVYRQGDKPDGLYLVESGVLKCTYAFADHVPDVVESCVAGTLSGELTALAGEPRNATVVAERQSILWKMTTAELARLEKDNPEDANLFVKLVLKTSKIDQDVLLTNLAQFRM